MDEVADLIRLLELLAYPNRNIPAKTLLRELRETQRLMTGNVGAQLKYKEVVAFYMDGLVKARDRIQFWSRPTSQLSRYAAGLFFGLVFVAEHYRRPYWGWFVGGALVLAVILAFSSEFWAQRWFDCVPVYDSLLAELGKLAEKLPNGPERVEDELVQEVLADAVKAGKKEQGT